MAIYGLNFSRKRRRKEKKLVRTIKKQIMSNKFILDFIVVKTEVLDLIFLNSKAILISIL